MHVAATDEHDEEGILISDVFCNPAIRRKMAEKRMKKMDLALKDLPAPKLEGPANADVTLIGWGSTEGVIREAVQQLNASGVKTNQIHFKYILPFHSKEATEILKGCKRTICVEGNSTGQFERILRAETGAHCAATISAVMTASPSNPRRYRRARCARFWPASRFRSTSPKPTPAKSLITTSAFT